MLEDDMASPVLSLRGVSKRFGGLVAVADVSMDIMEGELVGLIGPNGAGKSTLLKMVAGTYRPSDGTIAFRGKRLNGVPAHVIARLGVAYAHQIPRPFSRLSVLENVLVAAHSTVRVNATTKREDALAVLATCGLDQRAGTRAAQLTLLELKRLEVARALALQPSLLLLDEVGAGLIGAELDEITALIEQVRLRGVTVLLVEHVQALVRALAQRVVVLDWGRQIAEGTPDEVARDPQVISTYLGSGVAGDQTRRGSARTGARAPLLKVEGLTVDYGKLRAVHGVDLRLYEGEIVALLGANGAGKSSIARAIAGIAPTSGGRLWLGESEITRLAAHQRARLGVALCQEGRRLFTEMTVHENLELATIYVKRRPERRASSRMNEILDLFPVLADRLATPAGALSGGQQQMLAIARALVAEPRVLILDELSLGLAPAVVDELYSTLDAIRASGVSVLLVEQNVFRSLAIADHVYVIERGQMSLSAPPQEVRDDKRLRAAYFGETVGRQVE